MTIIKKTTSAGKGGEKLELPHIAGGNVKQHDHCGK